MLEALSYGFMQKALLGGVLIAIAAGLIGPFLVLRRLSLLGDGLAHLAFGGVALGLLFGINPLFSALVTVLIGSLVVRQLLKRNIYGDAAIALLLSCGVGLGIVVIGIKRGFTVDLFSYLIGSVLALSTADLFLLGGLLVLVSGFVWFAYKDLVFQTLSTELSALHRKHNELVQTAFTLLVAIVVVMSIRAVGILLVSALLVVPTLIALRFTRSFLGTLGYAVSAGVLAMLVGILSSYYLDVPPSGMIVMLLLLSFGLSLLYKK